MILGNVKTDKKLAELNAQWEDRKKERDSRKDFLEKQMKDLQEFSKKMHREFWNQVEDFFKENNRFPEYYTPKEFSIRFDNEKGYFILLPKSEVASLEVAKKLVDVLPKGLIEAIMSGQGISGVEL